VRRPGILSRLFALSLFSGLPAIVVAMVALSDWDTHPELRFGLTVVVAGWWLGCLLAFVRSANFHLRTLSNLLAALREGDFSFRMSGGRRDDAFGDVIEELNLLARTLRRQRVGDLEATALLRKVMGEIDVALFAFDSSERLRMINLTGERLLGRAADKALGRRAAELGLDACLKGVSARTVNLEFGGAAGRWEMRRGVFRQHGRSQQLVVLSDVSRALRAEELTAWKRLIRVIGHELNNSLAPIKSLAGSLERLVRKDDPPEDWRADLEQGLQIIASRSEALSRFMTAYSRLAKMPPPTLGPVDVSSCVARVAALETRTPVAVIGGPPISLSADQDQLEQLLINLVHNAADASLDTGREVAVAWHRDGGDVVIRVLDEGRGLGDESNLFVPFYTTKPGGSGIGLFLCRQIAEAHGGSMTLGNRRNGTGCEAVVRLPGRS